MSTNASDYDVSQPGHRRWHWLASAPWEHYAIWAAFLAMLCLLRHLLLILFLTFLLCYLIRIVIGGLVQRLAPGRGVPWLERLLSVVLFGFLLLGTWAVARWLGPVALQESQALLERGADFDPDYEFHQALVKTVGAYAFRQDYASPDSPRYRQEFQEFVEQGGHRLAAYDGFPGVETNVRRTIRRQLENAEKVRLSAELAQKRSSGPEFEHWLTQQKLVPAEVAQDPMRLTRLQREWRTNQLAQLWDEAQRSPRFQQQFRALYEESRKSRPQAFPYDYDSYLQLKEAYSRGKIAFIAALSRSLAGSEAASTAEVREAFRIAKQRELANAWWVNSHLAVIVRHHAESGLDFAAGRLSQLVGDFVSSLLSLPGQIVTVLLLSFFITVDFPNLRAGVRSLQDSRLRFLYAELMPGILELGHLVGKAFLAQGVISLLNAVLTWIALRVLGIDNALLLSVVVFIFSFIPVIGVLLSSIPIALTALLQSNGSLGLALYGIGAILVVHFIEATLLSPKIVGKMLHLHPVLGIIVLAIAEHYFGIWGLLLAYPVTVYLISRVMNHENTVVGTVSNQAIG